MNFEMVLFTADQAANRAALADGVAGVECTYVGAIADSPMTPDERQITDETAPRNCYASSVECYANGARNVHIRGSYDKHIGFVKVRPA